MSYVRFQSEFPYPGFSHDSDKGGWRKQVCESAFADEVAHLPRADFDKDDILSIFQIALCLLTFSVLVGRCTMKLVVCLTVQLLMPLAIPMGITFSSIVKLVLVCPTSATYLPL